jgi:hypothetical protein
MIKFNSKIMELKNTHHSQLNLTAQLQLGEKPQCNRGRRTWPAQASDEHGQCKLQVSLANASSRWAWPAQRKLQEGMEQAPGGEQTLGDYREVQRGRSGGGALTRRPGDTTVRYHHGMAGQCSRGHDGTKLGEVADDTSTKHLAHQA